MDDYIEHMTKGKQPAYWTVLLVIAGALSVLSLLFAFYNVFGILLFIAVSFGTYVVWLFWKVEYEYSYIGGAFTMEKILNKSHRRPVADTSASELIVLAPQNSDAVRSEVKNAKIIDCAGDCPADRKFGYVYNRAGQKTCLYIEVTDALLREARRCTPQKVKLN